MEFPYGHPSHHHHSHHHKRDDDPEDHPPPGTNYSYLDNPPPPPPPSFYGGDQPPPPPIPQPAQVYHTSHVPPSHNYNYSDFPPPQSDSYPYNYSSEAPPPPPRVPAYAPPPGSTASVHHVSHEVETYESESHRPHFPSFIHHHTHHESSATGSSNKRTVRVFSRASPNFSLTIRDGNVILAPSDPSDDCQHWFKDEKYSTRVKDQEGFPAFSLVNKATGEAIKHSIGATHPVRLIPYNSDYLDESILWSESKEIADGYRAIRMVNNIHLNVDAFHGDKRSGGIHDGTTIVLWEWNKGDNQLWRISPY
ncbi:hypothetical protein QN277_020872 [Acacia crassicarpa]|uniref:Uncharacterized protein n=1 Tax=Acacia crassicarpa TaxID=499986 RepID=A0AAE1JNW5_9FABA|nr:hypothetical protein QN277_020872 [Acacia crassicarpa]